VNVATDEGDIGELHDAPGTIAATTNATTPATRRALEPDTRSH
jgi:hypothetical protein